VATNSDMRLVIAGAGGRMGRTLMHAIAVTKGVTLAGAVEAAGSAVIGRDAGELAGLGANGIKVVSDAAPLLKSADGLIEFTIPAATLVLAELSAAAGIVHVIGTTGHSTEEEAVIAKAASRVLERLSPQGDRRARTRYRRAFALLAQCRRDGGEEERFGGLRTSPSPRVRGEGPLRWAQNRGEAPSPSLASLTRPLPAQRGEVNCHYAAAATRPASQPSIARLRVMPQ